MPQKIMNKVRKINIPLEKNGNILVYPPKPNLTQQEKMIENTEIAKAKSINALIETEHKKLEMLSALDEFDIEQLSLLLSIADDDDLNLGAFLEDDKIFNDPNNFLHEYCYHKLKLNNSNRNIKRGGIRSEQLKDVSKTPENNDNGNSIFGKIKNRFQ